MVFSNIFWYNELYFENRIADGFEKIFDFDTALNVNIRMRAGIDEPIRRERE